MPFTNIVGMADGDDDRFEFSVSSTTNPLKRMGSPLNRPSKKAEENADLFSSTSQMDSTLDGLLDDMAEPSFAQLQAIKFWDP